MYQSILFNKVSGLSSAILLKKIWGFGDVIGEIPFRKLSIDKMYVGEKPMWEMSDKELSYNCLNRQSFKLFFVFSISVFVSKLDSI